MLYHLLVLLESRQVAFADVLSVLKGRMGTSGLEEKASRSQGHAVKTRCRSAKESEERASEARRESIPFSPYRVFTREEWARLRADTPMTLRPNELEQLSGVIEELSVDEVEQIYLPLSRLLNLYVAAAQKLHSVSSEFLGRKDTKVPFIIGVAGSVAVGKEHDGRVSASALLARWPDHPRVDLLTTDGFLYPNAELERRGLMEKKGFPESFDTERLLQFFGRYQIRRFERRGAGLFAFPIRYSSPARRCWSSSRIF